MPYSVEIKDAIRRLAPGAFQNLCNDILNQKGYSSLVALGSKPGTNKTTLGTPDAYYRIDETGKYIFVEYTTQDKGLYNKIKRDILKCLDTEKTRIPHDKISEIIVFHISAGLSPKDDNDLHEMCQAEGIMLRLYGVDHLADELYNNFKPLIKQYLGIDIDTNQILTHKDFVSCYNSAKTAAPIDSIFNFREKELESIMSDLENYVVILMGNAGVGKTRLAIECCNRFADDHRYKFYCIRNNGLPIYEDLNLFFGAPGKYVLLIDDANELSLLDTIIRYCIEKKGSDFKIIMTVRQYAAETVIDRVKPLVDIKIHSISRLKDDEIKELIKEKYKVTNYVVLDHIASIAEGNARIAFLAGKIAADNDTLESIRNATDIYDAYYGKYLNEVLTNESKQFSAAAIVAFVGAIHIDKIENIAELLSVCDFSTEEFIGILHQLHDKEIINIYKDKAVKFADQCLSNYILYYVLVKKKWLKLSVMIKYNYRNNHHQTIESVNTIINLFENDENRETVLSELKALWNELSKEDPVFFWEYVKVFYLANPTEALLLVKEKIETISSVNLESNDLIIDEKRMQVDDDILCILGGFANRTFLDTALDLYFLYYQKRPDLISQFYNIARMKYGIDDYCFKYDFYTPIKFIEHFIDQLGIYNNDSINKLFVHVAKYFLNFHFDASKVARKYTFVIMPIDLSCSEKVDRYRSLLWTKLVDMYSQRIETKLIEDILYYYGEGSGNKSKEIIEHDSPYVLKLLSSFMEKDSYYFCRIIDNLSRLYTDYFSELDPTFMSFMDSKAYSFYKTISISPLDAYDKKANKQTTDVLEKYVAGLTKESFFDLIDFFCDSVITVAYDNTYAFNRAFELVFDTKDYYVEAIKYYYSKKETQLLLSPYIQVKKMFEKLSDREIWTMISDAPDCCRNAWQYCYFYYLPNKYIDLEHLDQWYDFLEDDSDRYITSSSHRDLFFLESFLAVDKDVVQKSFRIIIRKADYSMFIVRIYTGSIFDPTQENIEKIISLFYGDFELLSHIYTALIFHKAQIDSKGYLLKAVYEGYPTILDDLFNVWKNAGMNLRCDDVSKLSRLFEVDDYIRTFDSIFNKITELSLGRFYFSEDELSGLITVDHSKPQYADRPDKWIKHFIAEYSDDKNKMRIIFDAILDCTDDKRIEYLKILLSRNKNPEVFKAIHLLPGSMSWSGSELPVIKSCIDYLNKLLPLLNGLDFIMHRKYIEDKIASKKLYMKNVEIREILQGY